MRSDVDSINACTSIFGTLFISLQSTGVENQDLASPAVFSLRFNLESIVGALQITISDVQAVTILLVFPSLQCIGYGNKSRESTVSTIGDSSRPIQGVPGTNWNLTTTLFPAPTTPILCSRR